MLLLHLRVYTNIYKFVIYIWYFLLDNQLLITAIDYMFPAVTAVTGMMVYLIHHLLHRPDVEEKMVKEMENVVGKGRLPTLDDRQK